MFVHSQVSRSCRRHSVCWVIAWEFIEVTYFLEQKRYETLLDDSSKLADGHHPLGYCLQLTAEARGTAPLRWV